MSKMLLVHMIKCTGKSEIEKVAQFATNAKINVSHIFFQILAAPEEPICKEKIFKKL